MSKTDLKTKEIFLRLKKIFLTFVFLLQPKVFGIFQMLGLEKRFEKQQYLSTPDRVELAEMLGLSQLQVKTWYQNRRMKWKKQVI